METRRQYVVQIFNVDTDELIGEELASDFDDACDLEIKLRSYPKEHWDGANIRTCIDSFEVEDVGDDEAIEWYREVNRGY